MLVVVGCTHEPKKALEEKNPPLRPVKNIEIKEVDNGKGSTVLNPHPSNHRRKRLGVILGPGGFKTLAHVGVLKEMEKARLPVDYIVGLEWGALIAGLYAFKGQVHDLEWKIYKLEKQDFPKKSFLSNQLNPENIKRLSDFLADGFSRSQVRRTAISFNCPTQSLLTGELSWPKWGDLSAHVGRCMTYPPLFTVDSKASGAAASAPSAVQFLRREGIDIIVYVNVLNNGNLLDARVLPQGDASIMLWNEIRKMSRQAAPLVDEWVEVDTQGISMLEFGSRQNWISAGEKAGQEVVRKISERFGL